ncbi:MAG: NHL repeat-containing protein [Candidatus Riflebacteria bacterium]|nr:NHL repeat-containing protein [Candidatus Riflebacteria bacterium]
MKKLMVTALVLLLVANAGFAERLFDYRGMFPADRDSNAKITNYILLKKGARIRFEIEEQGHGTTEKITITKVQLTSDTSVSFEETSGIQNLDLPETGIYEITLVPDAKAQGEIRFILKVNDISDEKPAADSIQAVSQKPSEVAVKIAADTSPATLTASSSDGLSGAIEKQPDLPVTVATSATDVTASTQLTIANETASSAVASHVFPEISQVAVASVALVDGSGQALPVLQAPAAGWFINPFVGLKFVADSINLMSEQDRQKQIKIFTCSIDGSQSTVKGNFFSPEPDVLMFLPQAVVPGAVYYVEIFDISGTKINSSRIESMPELAVEFLPTGSDLTVRIWWQQQTNLLANPTGQMLALNNCDVVINVDGKSLLQLTSEQTRQPVGTFAGINWRARPYALELELPLSLISGECSVEILAAVDGAEQKMSAYKADWQKASVQAVPDDFSNVVAFDDEIYKKPSEEFSIASFSIRAQLPDETKFAVEKSFLIVDSSADSNVSWPQDVVWDENGSLWVLDSQLRRISNFNDKGQIRTSFGNRGDSQGAFGLPVALAQKNSTLFVSDTARHAIHKFTTDGLFVVSIFSGSDAGVAIDLPGGICFRKEEMWIADRGTSRILCFNQQGGFLGSFGSTSSAPIDAPVSVRADQDSLFILEKNGLVKKFSPMGQFDATFQSGSSDGSGLEVDSWGGVWVCDAGQFRVLRFSRNGATLCELKAPPAPKPWLPTSVAVRADGKIAVADAENKMLHIFTPTD